MPVGVFLDLGAKLLGIVVGLWLLGQWAKFMNMRVAGTKVGTWLGGIGITLLLWLFLF